MAPPASRLGERRLGDRPTREGAALRLLRFDEICIKQRSARRTDFLANAGVLAPRRKSGGGAFGGKSELQSHFRPILVRVAKQVLALCAADLLPSIDARDFQVLA